MKIYFANENPGEVRSEFASSTLELIMHDINTNRHVYAVDFNHSGAGVAMFRNQSIEKFLTTEAEAIFFVDSDIKFPPDTLDRLVDHLEPIQRPVISGLYFLAMDEGVRPAVFTLQDPEPGKTNRHMGAWPTLPDEMGLQPCDGVGAGCLLIHRSILEEMLMEYGLPQPWFADEIWYGEVYGEDLSFGQRMKKIGRQLYVDLDTQVEHIKPISLSINTFNAQRKALLNAATEEALV